MVLFVLNYNRNGMKFLFVCIFVSVESFQIRWNETVSNG